MCLNWTGVARKVAYAVLREEVAIGRKPMSVGDRRAVRCEHDERIASVLTQGSHVGLRSTVIKE
jgi:hypothetical protein